MLFWPILIIASVILAVFLTATPGAAPSAGDGAAGAVYLTVLALAIIFGGAGRILIRGGRRSLIHTGVWAAVFALVFGIFSARHEIGDLADRAVGGVPPSMALSRAEGEVELRRAWDGHYRADALVNGVEMRLMVDTGASMVLVPHERAASLGIDVGRLSYSMPVTTANGRSAVAPVRLDEVRVGPIRVDDVPAAVARPGRLEDPLLGMSFLERLAETSFIGNKLILRQGGRDDAMGQFISVSGQD